MLPLVSSHRTRIFEAIMAGKPEEAREASHRHLAFIEEILLDRSREESRRERSLRRLEQRKLVIFLVKLSRRCCKSSAYKARQLNVEPVLLSFPARVQWDRFQKLNVIR